MNGNKFDAWSLPQDNDPFCAWSQAIWLGPYRPCLRDHAQNWSLTCGKDHVTKIYSLSKFSARTGLSMACLSLYATG